MSCSCFDGLSRILRHNHVNRIEVPTLWIGGKQDTTLSQTLAHRYFNELEAPRGKRWVWYEDVAHPVHLEAPAQFRATLREFAAGLK